VGCAQSQRALIGRSRSASFRAAGAQCSVPVLQTSSDLLNGLLIPYFIPFLFYPGKKLGYDSFFNCKRLLVMK